VLRAARFVGSPNLLPQGLGTDRAPGNYPWGNSEDSVADGRPYVRMSGYVTLLVEAEIEAGVAVGRHTHPGVESAYVLEGGFELLIEGQPDPHVEAG
jgi:quercetin dioxygenase-like cupin family protein